MMWLHAYWQSVSDVVVFKNSSLKSDMPNSNTGSISCVTFKLIHHLNLSFLTYKIRMMAAVSQACKGL